MESPGETGPSPIIDCIVAKPSKMAMNPVRLLLTVERDQSYNLFWQGASKSCSCSVKRCSCS
jgi:hypothetical protein